MLAEKLGLPEDAFGDWAATDGMLHAARAAALAREDLARLETAVRALSKLSTPMNDVVDRLRVEMMACRQRVTAFPRKGPQNVAAYWIAEKVARTFQAHGRAVTYGQAPDGESPSTPYCRAVAMALEELNVNGGWRGPARAAWKAANN